LVPDGTFCPARRHEVESHVPVADAPVTLFRTGTSKGAGPVDASQAARNGTFCSARTSTPAAQSPAGGRAPILPKVASPVRFKYLLSLPERVLRSLGALSGGLLREIGNVALPAGVRRTALYRTMVEVALRFLIEEVGQVDGIYPAEGRLAERFLLQRTASHGIELLGILAFQASPIWVLAALADVSGGGRKLIRELSKALEDEGLLEPRARFETLDQLLDGLAKTSGHFADTLNLPPLDVPGLRREWARLKTELQALPPKKLPAPERVETIWDDLRRTAAEQRRSIFTVSSLMAVSAVAHVPANLLWLSRAARTVARRTGKVFGEAILDHYAESLREISETGFVNYWRREFRPYLRAAAEQFAPERLSTTERLLHRR